MMHLAYASYNAPTVNREDLVKKGSWFQSAESMIANACVLAKWPH